MAATDEVRQLEAVMLQMSVPDTIVVKRAETQIKTVLKNYQCVSALTQLLQSSGHASVRQLSAVLLRVKIIGFWGKLTEGDQTVIKQILLQSLENETERVVALNITYLIAAVSKTQFDSDIGPAGELKPRSFSFCLD